MLAPALSYEYIRPHISVVPKFTLNHTQYLLDDPDSVFDDNESRSVATFSLDTKLFMERQFSLFGQNHLQTFEPRLFYLAVPNVDQGGLPPAGHRKRSRSNAYQYRTDILFQGP